MDQQLLDINAVCKMLGTTSRTLRFYEEKGIISSTAVPFQSRRQYDQEQIEHIKKVLVLRSLGLPIAKIQELQKGNTDLSDTIAEHKAEIIASIVSKTKEIRLLDEALSTIKDGGDIFAEKEANISTPLYDRLHIANTFTDSFLSGDLDTCFSYFTEMLQEYLPLTAFKRVVSDTLKPLGNFVSKCKTEYDNKLHNVLYSYLEYEKLSLCIKLVFHKDKIHGIWLNYCELQMENEL